MIVFIVFSEFVNQSLHRNVKVCFVKWRAFVVDWNGSILENFIHGNAACSLKGGCYSFEIFAFNDDRL